MNKEFVPYEQAVALKELGFNEPCMAYRDGGGYIMIKETPHCVISAPTFSQVFRWFREKYGLFNYITTHDSTDFEWYVYDKDQNDWEDDTTQDTYEEAELACLRKLIEIVDGKLKLK